MYFPRSFLFVLVVGIVLPSVRCNKIYLNTQSTTNSWGTPGGTMCYTNSIRMYAKSQTLSITTVANIIYIRCWSGSSLIPTTANLIGGGIGFTTATIELSSAYKKIVGGCEAFCM